MDTISSLLYRVFKAVVLKPADFLLFGGQGVLWYSSEPAADRSLGGAVATEEMVTQLPSSATSCGANPADPFALTATDSFFWDGYTQNNPSLDVMDGMHASK